MKEEKKDNKKKYRRRLVIFGSILIFLILLQITLSLQSKAPTLSDDKEIILKESSKGLNEIIPEGEQILFGGVTVKTFTTFMYIGAGLVMLFTIWSVINSLNNVRLA